MARVECFEGGFLFLGQLKPFGEMPLFQQANPELAWVKALLLQYRADGGLTCFNSLFLQQTGEPPDAEIRMFQGGCGNPFGDCRILLY